MTVSSYDAVLFIGFGGPEKRDDVMPFLEIVTQGRNIPRERLEAVAHHYEAIGGASPINAITRRQAELLQTELATCHLPLPVYIGQRNWHPFLKDTLRKMADDGIQRAVSFVTAAHRCEASWERYVKATEEARRRIPATEASAGPPRPSGGGETAPVIDYVGPWFDHPLFIEAICERIKEVSPSPPFPSPYLRERVAQPGEGVSWIFTAHSIPTPMAESSRYVQELETTARLVCEKLGRTEWSLAYSSRSGRPQDPWLEPDVCDAIRQEAQKGAKEVLLIPIGFVADHVEVLYDLDIEAREAAKAAGVRLRRAKTVGDHPAFIKMISEVVRKVTGVRPLVDVGSDPSL